MRKIAFLAAALLFVTSLGRVPDAQASDPLPEPVQVAEASSAAEGGAAVPVDRAAPEPRAQAAAISGPEQLRAYWVDAFGEGFQNEAEIDRLIADVRGANLNAIVAQVVRRGDCFCNKSSLPRTDAAIAGRPFDPLESLIAKAHAQGIQVHAWIITTGLWRGTKPPPDPSHAFNLHGPAAAGSAYWLTKRSDGADKVETEYHLDPGHPDAADYVVRMATSIVENYDVDGVNLDRIRYPDGNPSGGVASWGYNPTAVARFQTATGRGDVPAPADPEWTQWRRDRVTDIVRRIYVETYRIRPSVRISVDTIVYGHGPHQTGGWTNTRTYRELLQDWVGWMRDGIVDLNIPMNYKRDLSADQADMYREWSQFAVEQQHGRATAIGTALYLNDIAGSVRQVRGAVSASSAGRTSAGWVGYSWRNPDDQAAALARSGAASRAELDRALTEWSHYDPGQAPIFAGPASVPAMPWKDAPATGVLTGTTADPYAAVEVRTGGATVRAGRSDARGWFGFVDLAPGAYTVHVGRTTYAATVAAGQVATATASGSEPCVSSVGPGLAPPASVPSGIPGYHAAWYAQSGYATLCRGERSTAIVAYYNSGSLGWVLGRMGEVAYLGTWDPVPGQDRVSILGGDGSSGSPATGWPRFNRLAVQPAPYVGPGQVAWFQFTVQAPMTPGAYRLAIRPLIEASTWMEDYGVFWIVTVK